jgi:hypothetical protein
MCDFAHFLTGPAHKQVRKLHGAGHSDIRTTDLYSSCRDDDAEKAARSICIRVPTRQGSYHKQSVSQLVHSSRCSISERRNRLKVRHLNTIVMSP